MSEPSTTCPTCERTSHNPNDVFFLWCDYCKKTYDGVEYKEEDRELLGVFHAGFPTMTVAEVVLLWRGSDEWQRSQVYIRADAAKAQARSQLQTDALVHRTFVYDAGMAMYCKVCGGRVQSMQPPEYFPHQRECPLYEIQERVKAAGGWPEREDELDWKPA